MTTSDTDPALKALNIEVRYIVIVVLYLTYGHTVSQIKLYMPSGHSGLAPLSFRNVQPASNQAIYVMDDEDIDSEIVLREDPVPIPLARAARRSIYRCESLQPAP